VSQSDNESDSEFSLPPLTHYGDSIFGHTHAGIDSLFSSLTLFENIAIFNNFIYGDKLLYIKVA
jgi:hypothetical protein